MSLDTSKDSIGNSARTNSKKDLIRFSVVMILGTLGMLLLLINAVSNWIVWYLYLGVWTLIEWRIAKRIKLKWWWWLLIILAILAVDTVIMEIN